jgi:dihydroxyacetone kinase
MTLLWLDDDLESLWNAPADTPAFCHGSGRLLAHGVVSPAGGRDGDVEVEIETPVPAATEESRAAASFLAQALRAVRHALDQQAQALGQIDSVAGDGDHGMGMQRGAQAAQAAAEDATARGAGVRTTLLRAADAWSNRGGGASGALWGAALRAAAAELSDESSPASRDVVAAVAAAATAVRESGKAKLGDKTMVDALEPFAVALGEAVGRGGSIAEAWQAACVAAARGADATASMVARVGRARPHGEKSIGTPDPGAASFVIVVQAVGPILAKESRDA